MQRLFLITAALLVFVLAVTACGGTSVDLETAATEAAGVTPSSSFNVVAKGSKFDTNALVVVAGAEVVISLENRDPALHNVAVYVEKGGDQIYRGELFVGPETREYRFEAPAAGVYYFRCDAHPEMEGVFIAR